MKAAKAGLSLRQKLALLLSGLSAAVLVGAVAAAYNEVRQSAMMAAEERLDRASHQLADLAEPGAAARIQVVRQTARDPAILAALRGWPHDSTALATRLETSRALADSGLAIQLWSAGRERVAAAAGTDLPPPPGGVASLLDSVPTYSPFLERDGGVFYWTAVPVGGDGHPGGWIVQLRRIGSGATAKQIQELIGSDSRVLFAHLGDSLWVTLAGEPVRASASGAGLDTADVFLRDGDEPRLARAALVGGTPWVVVVETPLPVVLARPRTFLERMLMMGLLLILLAMTVAWLASRRLTEPIRELAQASDAIRAGDYGRRVSVDRGDELGRLAAAFNAMTDQVSRSHEALRERYEEARSLAAELDAARQEAERARDQAQAANRAKSDFLATMSHEIRTPINAVIGYAELLEMGIPGPVTDEQLGYLDRIRRASQLLIALVNDVLDFAKLESGRMRVRPGIGSASEAVRSAVAVLEPDAERKGLSMSVECPREAAFLGDTQRVEQVLVNLLSNAVKFTPSGGTVRVRCALVDGGAPPAWPAADPDRGGDDGPEGEPWAGRWLRLDVEDTGIGIAGEQLRHIFEPFVQGESGYTRDHGGAGLGLSISASLTSMMGGRISVESSPGLGSTFTLWLRAATTGTEAPRESLTGREG